jgi:colicin import membrane protein
MEPAFKRALQISASVHFLIALAMFVNFNFFSKEEVIVVPLYSSSDAPLQASMIDNPKLKEAEKATRRKEEPKKEPPKKQPEEKEPPKEEPPEEDLLKKQQELKKQEELQKREEAKKLQAEKEILVKKKQEADAKKKKEEAELALKKKKEQEKLKKEQEKLKKEQDKKKAEEKAKQEKKKQEELAKKKKAEALKKKQAEERKRQQELERQAEEQLMDEFAEEADEARRAARQGQMLTEKQRYIAMIVERVRQSWFTDDTMNGKECVISLRLASNGFVTNLTVEGGDAGVCNAAVNAINRVGRFPMPEDPDLNDQFRELKLPFKK